MVCQFVRLERHTHSCADQIWVLQLSSLNGCLLEILGGLIILTYTHSHFMSMTEPANCPDYLVNTCSWLRIALKYAAWSVGRTSVSLSTKLIPSAGNFFSLQAKHEQAIQYFNRAAQLDPTYISAWTLMGHEQIEEKNSHAAIEMYRRAIGQLSLRCTQHALPSFRHQSG